MKSTSEMQNEIPDTINRRRIGYFAVGPLSSNSRSSIERYVQSNLVEWSQRFGPGKPWIEYNARLDRFELEWHRPKTAQEQAQEHYDRQRRLMDQARQEQARVYQNMAQQTATFASEQAQANALASLYGSGLQASGGSVEPSARVPVRVPRRQVGPASLWIRLKVFFIALLTGASPFRVYWEILHNALRVQDQQ